jgi:hypothetical protein
MFNSFTWRLVGCERLEARAMLSADAALGVALVESPVENAVQQPAEHQADSSCWIRLSQTHSGAGGDPDQPLIAGRLYNAAGGSPAALDKAFAELAALVPVGPVPKESDEKGGTEDINIGVGELQECTISKSMDRATTLLAQHAINGNSLGPVELQFVAAPGSASYLQYKLDRAFVKSWSTSGDADDRPTEEVAFYYNRIAFQYASTTDGAAR